MRTARGLFRAAAVACAALVSSMSFAGVTIDINQVGSDVVATVSGSFDTTGISTFETGSGSFYSIFAPNDGNFGFSNTAGSTEWINWSIYQDNFPPAYPAPFFGNGSNAGNVPALANSTSGVGTLYLQANGLSSPGLNEARLRLPVSYVSNGPINGTTTWSNKSYASMGIASSGTWSWRTENTSPGEVLFRINAVPEPAVCASGVIAAVTLGAWLRRRSAKA